MLSKRVRAAVVLCATTASSFAIAAANAQTVPTTVDVAAGANADAAPSVAKSRGAGQGALATNQTADAPQDNAGSELQDIVVTANRRAENAQQVPLAVTAIGGEQALRSGVVDAQSIALFVPGLQFNRQVGSSTPFLRGVGSPAGGPGRESSVGTYVDEVYLAYGGSSISNFSSLERIEIEKGPQGTLFGRNSTGGVVQVFTKDPSRAPALDVTAQYGNYDTPAASLYATGPITETVAANISFYWSKQHDGWGRNVVTGSTFGVTDFWGGRAKLLWTPTDATKVKLTVDHDSTYTQQAFGWRAFPGTKVTLSAPPPAGFYDVNTTVDGHTKVDQTGVSLKVEHEMPFGNLVSISSYRTLVGPQIFDQDGGSANVVTISTRVVDRTVTQELQLLSPAGSTVSWVGGIYFFHDETGYQPLSTSGLAFPFRLSQGFSAAVANSYAAFGQASIPLFGDATHLTIGGRYTIDTRSIADYLVTTSAAGVVGPATPASNSPQSRHWSQPSFRAVLDHRLSRDVMVYAGYNRGFKGGVYNTVPGATIQAPANPEILDAYTAGAKTEFLGRRARLNVEGFYYNYKNIQVTQTVPGGTIIGNAAAATIKGVDVDLNVRPVNHLSLSAAVEVMNGRFDSYPNGNFAVYNAANGGGCTFTVAAATAPIPCGGAVTPPNYDRSTGTWDLKGNRTVQTPPFSLTLSANYDIATRFGRFDLNASWSHTGNFYYDPDNGGGQVAPSSSNNDRQPIYDVVNLSLGWLSPAKGLELRGWAKNLNGARYYTYISDSSFGAIYSAAPPGTYGLTGTLHF